MKKTIFIFLLLSNLLDLKAQQNINFIVRDKTVDSKLEGYIYSTKNLKFNDEREIISLKNQFKKVEESVANFGLNNDENWIYFDIKNESFQNENFVLFLDQTFLEKADFYQFQNDSLVRKIELNQGVLLENRPVAYPNFAFPFQLKLNQKNSIFLRIKASKINGISRALVVLSDEKTFHKTSQQNYLFLGILVGFLLLTFVSGLILYYFGRKNIYLIYGIYILSILCYYLCNGGYLNALSANSLLGSPQFAGAILMLNTAFHLYFIEQFLQLKTQFSKVFQYLILGIIGVSALLSIVYLFLPIPEFLPYFVRFLLFFVSVLIIILSIWSFRKNRKTTLLYSLATFPSIILIIYFLLSAIKILPLFSIAFSFPFPCTVFEIIVFGIGLVYQFNQEKVEIELKLSEERRSVAQKLITTQEQERQRIAQDLHDDLGSTLAMLKNRLSESNETLDNQLVMEMGIADKAVDDLRVISHNLTPALFLQKGLKVAIEENTGSNSIAGFNPASVSFMCSGIEKKLGWEAELSIFRIAKELLNNALKHAKASNIELQLIYFDDFLYLSVEDNGIGYVKFENEIKGIGLKNVSLRVDYLNGKMNQESSENGTLITIEIPYEPSTKNQNSSH